MTLVGSVEISGNTLATVVRRISPSASVPTAKYAPRSRKAAAPMGKAKTAAAAEPAGMARRIGVPQAHLPNVAGEDIPAFRQRDREQDEEDEVEDVVARDGQRQERQRSEGEENAGAPGELASIRE